MQKVANKTDHNFIHTGPCEDEANAHLGCQKLGESFYANFRTINGECNNMDNPLNGSQGCRLSRLLPGDHMRVKTPTYFDKPINEGNVIY